MADVLQEMEAVGDAIYDLHLWALDQAESQEEGESKDEDDDGEEPGGEEGVDADGGDDEVGEEPRWLVL